MYIVVYKVFKCGYKEHKSCIQIYIGVYKVYIGKYEVYICVNEAYKSCI